MLDVEVVSTIESPLALGAFIEYVDEKLVFGVNVVPSVSGIPVTEDTFNLDPSFNTSKCKCEPLDSPVFPSIPITVPLLTISPCLTINLDK